MIPAYRRHTVRCVACAAPEVTTSCTRCLLPFCAIHAPEEDVRCGICEAEWAYRQAERRTWREDVLQPLAFALGVSVLVVSGVVSSWPWLSCIGAGVLLLLAAHAPRLEAEAQRRAFMAETFERARR